MGLELGEVDLEGEMDLGGEMGLGVGMGLEETGLVEEKGLEVEMGLEGKGKRYPQLGCSHSSLPKSQTFATINKVFQTPRHM